MKTRSAIILTAILFLSVRAQATEWLVGPGRTLTMPSQAAAVAKDGDTVTIEAGSYVDCATWTQNNLLIRGVGGFAHLRDKSCGGKALWIIQGRNTTVRDIEFSGATVTDKNGAGIRQEGADLTVSHCYFHDNENGILTGANSASRIRIESSVFDNNGYGDGYSHNMYIGHVGSFEITGCWTHRARVGHNIKSRADTTRILYNRISNEADGTASRDIDVPNGGWTLILGNELQHGPQTQNSNTCGYGLEGLTNPSRVLTLASNTFVNQRSAGSFVQIPASGTDTVRMINNLFVGAGSVLTGAPAAVDSQANLLLRAVADARFADAAAYDYRLTSASPAVGAGVDRGPSLRPELQYAHPAGLEPRRSSGAIDIGAHEYDVAQLLPYLQSPTPHAIDIFPNPTRGDATIPIRIGTAGQLRVVVCNSLGLRVRTLHDGSIGAENSTLAWDGCDDAGATLPRGAYYIRMQAGNRVVTKGFLLIR